MQKDAFIQATDNYIQVLKDTQAYQNYCKIKTEVQAEEGLWQQLCDYRKRRYEFQTMTNPEELFDRADAFEREFREWKKNPKVMAFLDAELALCRMLQESNMRIVEAVQFE